MTFFYEDKETGISAGINDDFSLFWGCVWAAVGIVMVWAATFFPDPEGL